MSGMIDDVRTLLQDLVTPDLKSLQTHVSNLETKVIPELEKKLGDGIPALKEVLTERFGRLENLIITSASTVQSQIKAVEAQVKILETQLDLAKRVEELERSQRKAEMTKADVPVSPVEAQEPAGV